MTPSEILYDLQCGRLSPNDQREAAHTLAKYMLDLQIELWKLRDERDKKRETHAFKA